PEDVVDEYEHVRVLNVAEVFGDGQSGEADAQSRSRRLVHLTIDQSRRVYDSRLLHLEIEIVSLARALTDAAEHRLSAVSLGDVIDQLHDDDSLADAGATEESDLSTLYERRDQVNDLDPRLEDLGLWLEIGELGRRTMDRPALDAGGNWR